MATSKKIEEKYQKMLKEIQKRPENRHCFDCSGRGNQYVVLNYGVFVCTTCSGIHREEQHKIKSVGMSTFSTEEIKALERGGNGTAKSIWLAKACAARPRHPSHSASAPVTTPPLDSAAALAAVALATATLVPAAALAATKRRAGPSLSPSLPLRSQPPALRALVECTSGPRAPFPPARRRSRKDSRRRRATSPRSARTSRPSECTSHTAAAALVRALPCRPRRPSSLPHPALASTAFAPRPLPRPLPPRPQVHAKAMV